MSKFEDLRADTPRLVVEFERGADGTEQFKWGIVGSLPRLTLIGYVGRVQAELQFRCALSCPQMALVIAWDDRRRAFSYFVHPDVPVDSLVGMLEVAKQSLVMSQLEAQLKAAQAGLHRPSGLIGVDGRPIMKRG